MANRAKELYSLFESSKDVFQSKFPDGVVVWSPITINELETILRLQKSEVLSEAELEDLVWERAVIESTFGKEEVRKAGVVSTVVYHVLYVQGYGSDLELFNGELGKARYNLGQSPISLAAVFIARAFPAINPLELTRENPSNFFKLLAMAESAANMPFELLPSGEKPKRKKQMESIESQINYAPDTGGRDLEASMINTALHEAPHYSGEDEIHENMTPEQVQAILLKKAQLTYYDIHPKQKFINTALENQRMIEDGVPMPEEYKDEMFFKLVEAENRRIDNARKAAPRPNERAQNRRRNR